MQIVPGTRVSDVCHTCYEHLTSEPCPEDCKGFDGGCGSPSCLTCSEEPEEPCCFAGYSTRGRHHEPHCPEA